MATKHSGVLTQLLQGIFGDCQYFTCCRMASKWWAWIQNGNCKCWEWFAVRNIFHLNVQPRDRRANKTKTLSHECDGGIFGLQITETTETESAHTWGARRSMEDNGSIYAIFKTYLTNKALDKIINLLFGLAFLWTQLIFIFSCVYRNYMRCAFTCHSVARVSNTLLYWYLILACSVDSWGQCWDVVSLKITDTQQPGIFHQFELGNNSG